MQALLSMVTATTEAARYNRAHAAAEWPSISEDSWERLSPDGWSNAVVTGGPARNNRVCHFSTSSQALQHNSLNYTSH